MKKLLVCIGALLICLGLSFSTFALTTNDAKKNGWVGEQSDGYLGVVSQNMTDKNKTQVQSLVNQVNQQRKQEYISIAKNNGTDVSQVQTVAAKTLIGLARPGEYVKNSMGSWVEK